MTGSRLGPAGTSREGSRNPWLGVELRHLAALSAVAREGSFRGAADSLGYVQSAVSQQLAQLERVVGRRLVERERGSARVVMTPAGELMLLHAERLLAGLGAAHADLEELAEGGAGRLRVGVCRSLGGGILARVLPGLLRSTPKLRIEVTEAAAGNLAAEVAEGSLDAAFAEVPIPDGPFVGTKLCNYRYVVVAHPDSGAARAERPLDVSDLNGLSFIGHPLMDRVEPLLQAAGVKLRYELSCESLLALPALVAAGSGCAIVPSLLWDREFEQTVTVPLHDLLPERTACVFRHSEREDSTAADLLIAHAVEVYSPLAAPLAA